MKNTCFADKTQYKVGYGDSKKKSKRLNSSAHVLNDNMELEVEPEEVSLKSFRKQNHLADNIWEGTELNPHVRAVLMDISDDFWEYCKIRWVKPEDVIITGSICNYNWSEFSDIDLHLIVDFSKVHDRTDFVKEYFDDKKNSWNEEHDSLKIYGFPVELYVQDISESPKSGGEYDLWKNEWIRTPEMSSIKPIELNKYAIKEIAADLMTQIDDLCDEFEKETDSHKIEVLGDKCEGLCKKISSMRKKSLAKHGESGIGNIVYKCLRRAEYLDKIWNLIDKIYDKLNSIDESIAFNKRIREDFYK